MSDKIKECKEPTRESCRGCKHSFDPSKYDGGCKLLVKSKKPASYEDLAERLEVMSKAAKSAVMDFDNRIKEFCSECEREAEKKRKIFS